MPNPNSPLARLLDGPMRPGRVTWIGIRRDRRAPVAAVKSALLVESKGTEGDHYDTRRNGRRQVTLIQREHLEAIASFLGLEQVEPEQLRRKVVVEGLSLLALKDRRFRMGEAVLERSGECNPCGRWDQTLGPGACTAMRRRGRITTRVLKSGIVRLCDVVERLQST